jgi:prepilin-type N-terminal cleavage/methylation domain-containing protein
MLDGMQTVVPHRRSQRGYTLIEVMVVLVIAALVATATIPNVMRTMIKAQGKAELTSMQNGLALVRTRSIQTGGQAAVWFDLDSGPQGEDVVRGWIDANGSETLDAGEAVLLEHVVDPRLTLAPDTGFMALAGNSSHRGALFQPNGTVVLASGAVGSANLVVTDQRGNTVRLVLQAPAGTSRTQMKIPGTTDWDDSLKHWRF